MKHIREFSVALLSGAAFVLATAILAHGGSSEASITEWMQGAGAVIVAGVAMVGFMSWRSQEVERRAIEMGPKITASTRRDYRVLQRVRNSGELFYIILEVDRYCRRVDHAIHRAKQHGRVVITLADLERLVDETSEPHTLYSMTDSVKRSLGAKRSTVAAIVDDLESAFADLEDTRDIAVSLGRSEVVANIDLLLEVHQEVQSGLTTVLGILDFVSDDDLLSPTDTQSLLEVAVAISEQATRRNTLPGFRVETSEELMNKGKEIKSRISVPYNRIVQAFES